MRDSSLSVSCNSPLDICNCLKDRENLLRNNGVSECLYPISVHSSGSPVNHSTQRGFRKPVESVPKVAATSEIVGE